jgi:hypothetical protein
MIVGASLGGAVFGGLPGAAAAGMGMSTLLNAAGTADYQYQEGIDTKFENWIGPTAANFGLDVVTGMSVGSTLRKIGQQAVVKKAAAEMATSNTGRRLEALWNSGTAQAARTVGSAAIQEAAINAGQAYVDIATAKALIGLDQTTLRPEDKRMLLEAAAGGGMFGGMHGLVKSFVTKYGVDPWDPNHAEGRRRLLNSSEYAHLKRAPIVI